MADIFTNEVIHSLVVNMEHKAFDQGLAQALSEHLDAPFYTLEELRGDTLYQTVQKEIHLAQTSPLPLKRN